MNISDLISYAKSITTSMSNVDDVLEVVISYGRTNGFVVSRIEKGELKAAIEDEQKRKEFDEDYDFLFDSL